MFPEVKKYKYIFRQCLFILAILICGIIGGAGMNFSATLLPQLKKNDTSIPITDDQGTWITSVLMLGFIPSPIIGSILSEYIGRKWASCSMLLLNSISWIIIALSSEVWQLLVGRTLQGLATGSGLLVLYCFMCEVALDKYRSTMVNFISIGLTTGMLFADLLGTYYSWRVTAWVLVALSLPCFGIFIYLRNTYVWYLNRNRQEEAKIAFYWYRGTDQRTIDEFKTLNTITSSISLTQLRKECMKREFLIPLFIVLWFKTTVVCSGGTSLALYSIEIMENIISIDAYLTTIIIDILRIFSGIVTSILLTFCPIRRITIVGCVICSLAVLTICCSLYWKDEWDGLSWLSFASIILFTFVYNLGLANVCNISPGELFTGISKSTGLSLAEIYYCVIFFLSAQLVPLMFKKLGSIWGFAIFGIGNLIGGIGLYFILPETRHLTSNEVKEYFKIMRIFRIQVK